MFCRFTGIIKAVYWALASQEMHLELVGVDDGVRAVQEAGGQTWRACAAGTLGLPLLHRRTQLLACNTTLHAAEGPSLLRLFVSHENSLECEAR